MEGFGVLIVVIIVGVLLLRAVQTANRKESIKNDIQTAAEVTARSIGQTAALVKNTARAAALAYSDGKAEPSNARIDVPQRTEKYEAIARLKALLDAGAISQDEYEREKKVLLS